MELTLVPFVPVSEWRWLQRAEGASLIGLLVTSIPAAPTEVFCFQSVRSLPMSLFMTLEPKETRLAREYATAGHTSWARAARG